MRFRGNPRWTAALAGAAVVCLLAVPLRLEPLGRWGSALGGAAHVVAQCVGHGGHPLLSMAERSPSDSRLKEMEVMKIITPGSAATSGCV